MHTVPESGSPRSRSRSRSRSHSHRLSSTCLRPRTFITLLKIAVPLTLIVIFGIFYLYEPHVEIAFYPREWIHREIDPVGRLAGCFDEGRISPSYNASKYLEGPKKTEVHAGMGMRLGMDCYEFAATIPPPKNMDSGPYVPPDERTQYHTYWRVDLAPFSERQEWMLKSFFATQDHTASRLIMWSNGDLSTNPILALYANMYPNSFVMRVVDTPDLATGTALEGSSLLKTDDKKAWTDGDLVRLLVIWNYGGVWIDMDSLLTRDLSPLLEHEFVTQWDCYDKIYQPLNGALMHFQKHSPYLCEAFHIMATSAPPRADSTDWGALLYLKLWRRLLGGHIPPFKILPFCFSDARSCRLDNRLPDPFDGDGGKEARWWRSKKDGLQEGGELDSALGSVFAVHLHNQWEKTFPKGGWVDRLLLNRYEEKLSKREGVDDL
ncbi:glycosyltransferase family 32 protein [Rhizopogon vinicolor AM-OR11-026]|uniref:Glycosyltransferase family 32 protein n=1 Tax=Rhizopogon vinicolor AM-OR11-026 TaxID=1314800 RepID=A0A1B7NC16_9AGAM|nr:glycosyltransferase family 32 protein [Rhizopogon vinicolor AM-OR11-026]